MLNCSLQTKTNKKAVLKQRNRNFRKYDTVVTVIFDRAYVYRNLQRQRAVLPSIARLSCLGDPEALLMFCRLKMMALNA